MTTPTRPTSAAEWFAGRSLEDIQRLELGGRMLYPDTIKRVDPKDPKKTIDQEVYLRVPSVLESAQARVEALAWARKVSNRDVETEDRAVGILGTGLWNEIDLYCLASYAILTPEVTPRRLMLPEFLLECIPRSTVYDVWRRVTFHSASEDVGTQVMTVDEVLAVAKVIATKGNLSPLVGTSEGMQRDFVIRAARLLTDSRQPNVSSN